MNRLTKRTESGNTFFPKCFEEPCLGSGYCRDDNCEMMYKVSQKLADYEDAEEQGLLLKLPCKEAYSMSGGTVYFIFEDEITECVHCGMSICPTSGRGFIALATNEDVFPYRNPDPEHDLDPTDWCTNTIDVEVDEIGKTLFFTREEAEKKLEEMQDAERK